MEMLEELTLRNFKVFDEVGVTINPGLVTILVGPNGTGKSTLLQALVLLRQSLGGTNLLLRPPDHTRIADFGEFEDVVHLHEISRDLEIQVGASYAGCHLPPGTSPALPANGSITFRVVQSSDWATQMEQQIGSKTENLRAENRRTSNKVTPGVIQVRGAGGLHLEVDRKVAQLMRIASPQYDQPMPEGASERIQSLCEALSPLLVGMDSFLQNVHLVPAIRGLADRSYKPPFTSEGVRPSLPADRPEELARLVTNLVAQRPQIRFRLAERLAKIFERPDIRVSLRQVGVTGHATQVEESGRATNIVDEAFGLNQLVAPVLWLSLAEENSVVGIEEPELHLHPKAQTALCESFVELAIREQKQIILTTHSEHIVMGLLTAVARGELQPDQLAIYELSRQGETAKAERLEVNEFGQVKGGLHSFLEADIEQLNEFISAQVRSK